MKLTFAKNVSMSAKIGISYIASLGFKLNHPSFMSIFYSFFIHVSGNYLGYHTPKGRWIGPKMNPNIGVPSASGDHEPGTTDSSGDHSEAGATDNPGGHNEAGNTGNPAVKKEAGAGGNYTIYIPFYVKSFFPDLTTVAWCSLVK